MRLFFLEMRSAQDRNTSRKMTARQIFDAIKGHNKHETFRRFACKNGYFSLFAVEIIKLLKAVINDQIKCDKYREFRAMFRCCDTIIATLVVFAIVGF